MSQITLHNVSFAYEAGKKTLDGIEHTFQPGSRTALVGPNGAGKSSLLLAMTGFLAIEGDIIIDGQRLTHDNLADLRKLMSFVFQDPDDMLFMPSVLENVIYGLNDLGLDTAEAQARGHDALSKIGLDGFEERPAHQLSFGERRRVTLASMLVRESPLNLFDEPTRELDPHGRRQFIDLFKGIDATLVLATHDLELVLETCEQMILLDGGRIIATGAPEELLSDQELMEAHRLEVPHSLMRHPHAHQ